MRALCRPHELWSEWSRGTWAGVKSAFRRIRLDVAFSGVYSGRLSRIRPPCRNSVGNTSGVPEMAVFASGLWIGIGAQQRSCYDPFAGWHEGGPHASLGREAGRSSDPQRHTMSRRWFAHRGERCGLAAYAHDIGVSGLPYGIRPSPFGVPGRGANRLRWSGGSATDLWNSGVCVSLAGNRNGWQANAQHATGRSSGRLDRRRKIVHVL